MASKSKKINKQKSNNNYSKQKSNKNTNNNNYHKQRTVMSQNGYSKEGNKDPQTYNKIYDSEDPTNSSPNTNIPNIDPATFVPPTFNTPGMNFPSFNPNIPPFNPNIPPFNFSNFNNFSADINVPMDNWPNQFNVAPNMVQPDYPDWLKNQMAQVNNQTNNIKKKDPQLYLNKALFYYYNQYPNFNPNLKPHASPAFSNFSFLDSSYYDKLPEYYYNVAQKIKSPSKPKN